MRILLGVLCILMISFVYVQYNDPDPALWMCLYGFCALMLGMGALGRFYIIPIIIGLVVYTAGALYLSPSVFEWIEKEHGQNLMQRMNNSKIYIEETRECLGLVITSIMMLILLFVALKERRKSETKVG